MSDQARAEILAAIRGALGADISAGARNDAARQAAPSVPAPTSEGLAPLLERFCDRVRDYGAGASRVGRDEVGRRVGEIASRHGARRLVVPAGLQPRWRAAQLELVDDDERLGPRELERFDGALTAAALASGETGTPVLDAGPDQRRRAVDVEPRDHRAERRGSGDDRAGGRGDELIGPAADRSTPRPADPGSREDPLHGPQLPRPRGGGRPAAAVGAAVLRQVPQLAH